jgi:2-dehydropantoate 2-reductase
VLFTVKCTDTETAARAMAPHLKPSTLVVSFQNGIGNAALIERHLPHQPVLAGMVPFNVLRRPDGVFHQGTSGALVVEKAAGLETSLAWAFGKSEIEVVHHPNMKGVLWGKLIFNLNNALNALAGIPLREEISDPHWRKVLAACMEEALAVLKASDIQPARFGRMAPTLAPRILRLPNAVFFAVAGAMVKIDPEARSSMWEDLQRKRPTEIAFLNGAIVELGRKIGRPTPVNTAVVETIRHAEKQGAGSPQLTAEKLAQRMGLGL